MPLKITFRAVIKIKLFVVISNADGIYFEEYIIFDLNWSYIFLME